MPFEVLALVGPTASGKTKLALELAHELAAQGKPVEIVNADAMQLYRHMNIGTAKLDAADREGIPHHLFDVISPSQEMTAVEYQSLARSHFAEIIGRGSIPMLVGGSMFYISAALDELSFAPTDPQLRARLETEAKSLGGTALHDRLRKLDPDTATRIPAQNVRRVIRALEVIELTGDRYQSEFPAPVSHRPTLQIGLEVDRELLKQRIAQRVDKMWELGILDEARWLLSHFELSKTARAAIGYQQAFDQLSGACSEAEAKSETIRLTSRYARRQMSWFRRDSRIQWVAAMDNPLGAALNLIRLEQ